MMRDSEFKIRVKIILGYVLITLFTLFVAWWGYLQVVALVVSDQSEQSPMYEKSILTSSLISSLYKADYHGNRLTESYSRSNLMQYQQALAVLSTNMDSLRSMVVDPKQVALLDRMSELLLNKRKNTRDLAVLRLNMSDDDSFQQTINRVMVQNRRDSTEKILIRSVYRNDTIAETGPKKRKFFQRIADVFSPKTDSVRIVSTQQTDTLRVVSTPNDTIEVALQRATAELINKRSLGRLSVSNKLQVLLSNEQQISNQISLLIADLNREATDNALTEFLSKRDLLHDSGRKVAFIAVVSLLLIVIFLTLVLRDLTKSGRYKRRLEAARLHAEELMHSRQRLLLNISHDIKAPLCSITGYLDLMESSTDKRVKQYADSMKLSTSYIMALITNLLEYARLEAGRSVSTHSVFDINSMFTQMKDIFTPLAAEKSLDLIVERSGSAEPAMVESDAVRLRQIVINLVSNAIKFTDSGQVLVRYTIQSEMLIVVVEDTGRGIEKSKQKSVFEEFERGVSEEFEGSGLGLAVVQGAVRLLGGEIVLESEVGRGTIFTVTMPIISFLEHSEMVGVDREGVTILVVDDDRLQLKMVSEMLKSAGHLPVTAQTIKEVDKLLEINNIDIILTDLQMGAFSGYKLLIDVRKRGYHGPVVAVSASDRSDHELKKAGFDDFLKKPFGLRDLRKVINVNCRGLNISALTELMGGDEDAAKDIAQLFINSTIENIAQLKIHLTNGEYDQLRALCHKMLPMFLQLGISDVGQLLKQVDMGDVSVDKIERIIAVCQQITAQYPTV